MATHLPSHFPEIAEHEKQERTTGSVWTFVFVVAALFVVIAIALAVR